jgi:hypothetical protein
LHGHDHKVIYLQGTGACIEKVFELAMDTVKTYRDIHQDIQTFTIETLDEVDNIALTRLLSGVRITLKRVNT